MRWPKSTSTNLMLRTRIALLFLLIFQFSHAQSWFSKNFEIDKVELKVGQSGLSKVNWKDNLYGASALDYLDDANDNIALKQDLVTKTRPFDVQYDYSDLSGYCCGSDFSNTNIRSEIGVKAQFKKTWRLRVGISLNLVDKAFGDHDRYPLDDTPYGDHTLYFQEVGKTDAIRLTKGYGQGEIDTTLYVPRAKLAYFAHPKSFIGLGLNGQFVLHESLSKRNHLTLNFGGSFMTAINNTTTIQLVYYDYSRISSGEYGSGHINGYYTGPNDYYRIEVDGRKSNRGILFEYKTPAINNAQINYGLEFSRKLFKNGPLTMSLGFGTRLNTYWRNWKTIATTKAVFYQAGFGWLIKQKRPPSIDEDLT